MQTILLTGANGLLGQKLTNLLCDRTAVQLIATSKGANRNPNRKGYIYEAADITEFYEVQLLFEKYKPQAIIHTAAMTNVDACETNPEASRKLNVDAVQSICELCKMYGTRMIHVSTDFIFDGLAGPYDERATPNPLSVYGNHKLQAEEIVQTAGIPAAIARTILLYGVIPDASRSNIVLWVKQSLEANKKIQVVTDQFRTPTLAEDLADGVSLLYFQNRTGLYNLSGVEFLSIFELACRVADFWNLDKSLITPVDGSIFSQPAKRPPKTGFIILKAQTELGYKPHLLEAGFKLVDRQLQELAKSSID